MPARPWLVGAAFLLLAGEGLAQVNTTFVPLRPCRVVDTRLMTRPPRYFGPLLLPGVARPFKVRGETLDLSFQGGNPAGCGVPVNAVAVAFDFVAVNASGPGHLTAWTDHPGVTGDETAPLASVLNYDAGVTVANQVPLEVDEIACGFEPCYFHWEFLVEAAVSATDMVADAYGYYLPVPAASATP